MMGSEEDSSDPIVKNTLTGDSGLTGLSVLHQTLPHALKRLYRLFWL